MGYDTTAWTTAGNTLTIGGTTLYKEFGVNHFSPYAGYHFPLFSQPAGGNKTYVHNAYFGGNGTDPATTLDVSGLTRTENAVAVYWPVPAAITLLSVKALVYCEDSDTATINVHLFSYDMDDSPAGDLSGGTVHASGTTTCTNAQVKQITCTLDSASISSGKTVVAFVENATDTDDVTVSMQVQYYINI